MSSSSLYRLSAVALIAGSLVAAIGYLLKPPVGADIQLYSNPLYKPSSLLAFSGALLLILGLPGMYAFQASRAGRFGLVSFVVVFLGLLLLEVGTGLLYTFIPPFLASNPVTQSLVSQPKGGGFEAQLGNGFLIWLAAGLLGSNLGALLYGIAAFRAQVYPRPATILIFGGVIVGFLLSSLHSAAIGDRPIILMFAGLAWCGVHLWQHA